MNTFNTLKASARRIALPALLATFSLTGFSALAQPDLNVAVDGPIPAGNYNNVTVQPGISATVSGQVNVAGTFLVKSTAELSIADLDFVSGNNFVLEDDGVLRLETILGINGTTSGPIRTVNKNLGTKGRFVMNSSSSAQFTGSGFPDEVSQLVVNNPIGLTLSRPLGVRENLEMREDSRLITNGFKLTLISREPDIAMVTAASAVVVQEANTAIIGAVTAQRYINPRFNPGVGYRHFSSSVSGNRVSDFSSPSNFDAVVNPQYNTVPYSRRFITGQVLPYPNTFFYDETQVGTGGNGSYNYVFTQGYQSPASLEENIVTTRGYSVRLPASSVVEFTGTLNNGPITTPLLTRSSIRPESGWHMVGNPYPSKVNWTLLIRSGMLNSFYKNRSTGATTGVYDSYVDGVSNGPSGSEYIAANQAVFVRVAQVGVSGTITFRNGARIRQFRNDPTAPFFRGTANTPNPAEYPLVRLALQSTTTDALEIESVVRFRTDATTGVDGDYDAFFLDGGYPLTLYSQTGAENLSINSLPELTSTTDYTVPLVATTQEAGTYKIGAKQLLNVPAGVQVLLQDALTGTTQDLTINPVYSFSSAEKGGSSTRFTLHVRAAGVTGLSDVSSTQTFDVYPNPIKTSERLSISLPGVEQGKTVTAVLVNQIGQQVWSGSFRALLGGVREEVKTSLSRGVYTLQVTLPDGAKQSRRVIVQ